MKNIARLIGLTAIALAAAQATAADLKIGFISSLSGPISPSIRCWPGARSS
jgi:branched-chain amino acid transport system substrate-binding protein